MGRKPTARQLNQRMDETIEYLYKLHCSGLTLPMLDIGKVFKAGREAYRAVITRTDGHPTTDAIYADVKTAVITAALEAHRSIDPHCTCNDCIDFAAKQQPELPLDACQWFPVPGPVVDGTCQWFARCDRPATSTTPHPVLGDVPTCDECHAFAERMRSGVRR